MNTLRRLVLPLVCTLRARQVLARAVLCTLAFAVSASTPTTASHIPTDKDIPLIRPPLGSGDDSVEGYLNFYNDSFFDGKDPTANARDDDAIAADKQALLPAETASFANYTSYSRGTNGIMVDISGLGDPEALGADDFQFKVGNTNDPGNWTSAPISTSLTLREVDDDGDEVADFDRITVIWPDSAIQKQWLQVAVLATENTGLAEPDVFYFGNAVGETGNSAAEAMVTSIDEIGARSNPHILIPVAIDDAYDFDRDSMVTSIDQVIARHNLAVLDVLRLITAPAADVALAQASEQESASLEQSLDDLHWLLYEFEMGARDQRSDKVKSSQQAAGNADAVLGEQFCVDASRVLMLGNAARHVEPVSVRQVATCQLLHRPSRRCGFTAILHALISEHCLRMLLFSTQVAEKSGVIIG